MSRAARAARVARVARVERVLPGRASAGARPAGRRRRPQGERPVGLDRFEEAPCVVRGGDRGDAGRCAPGEGRPLAGEQDPQRAGARERVSPAQGDDRPRLLAPQVFCRLRTGRALAARVRRGRAAGALCATDTRSGGRCSRASPACRRRWGTGRSRPPGRVGVPAWAGVASAWFRRLSSINRRSTEACLNKPANARSPGSAGASTTLPNHRRRSAEW